MLYEILKHIRNYFPDLEHQMTGHFKIEDGAIDPFPIVHSHQYLLIEGSSTNDGVYDSTYDEYLDEEFDGIITPLKIPKDFLSLVAEIEAYQSNVKASPFVSESFGGYSYTRATKDGKIQSWQDAFSTRLNAWRKI